MSVIRLPRSYQAPAGPLAINWSSPLARGLVGYWPLSSAGNVELISGLAATPAGGLVDGGDPVFGRCAVLDGTDDSITATHRAAYNQSTPFSAAIWMRSVTNDQGVFMGRYDNDAANSIWMLWRNGGNVLVYLNVIAVGAGSFDTGFAGTDGLPHLLSVDIGPQVRNLYVDGRFFAGDNGHGAGALAASTVPYTFGTATAIGFAQIAGLAHARLWNRQLSASEHAELYQPSSRWDLLRQPSRRLFVNSVAAAATGTGQIFNSPIFTPRIFRGAA